MNNNKNQYRQENKKEIGKTSNVSTKDEKKKKKQVRKYQEISL